VLSTVAHAPAPSHCKRDSVSFAQVVAPHVVPAAGYEQVVWDPVHEPAHDVPSLPHGA
jgi:hypothetical protein